MQNKLVYMDSYLYMYLYLHLNRFIYLIVCTVNIFYIIIQFVFFFHSQQFSISKLQNIFTALLFLSFSLVIYKDLNTINVYKFFVVVFLESLNILFYYKPTAFNKVLYSVSAELNLDPTNWPSDENLISNGEREK